MTKKGITSIVASVLLLAAIALTLLTIPTPSARRSVGIDAGATSSQLASQIDQLAVDFSANSGDSSPTQVSWVATTLGPAANLLADVNLQQATSAAIPVYALEISGNFRLSWVSTAPTGTDLWLIVRQDWTPSGYGVLDDSPSMQSLGTVETDSLIGIAPTTMAAWRLKYHVSAGSEPACISTGRCSLRRIHASKG